MSLLAWLPGVISIEGTDARGSRGSSQRVVGCSSLSCGSTSRPLSACSKEARLLLRSREGDIFEAPHLCAAAIAETLAAEIGEQVPVPASSTALGHVLNLVGICERSGSPSTGSATDHGMSGASIVDLKVATIEEICWTADYLALDGVLQYAFVALAEALHRQGPGTGASNVRAIRHLLVRGHSLPGHYRANALYELAITGNAKKGDQDTLHAAIVCLNDADAAVRRAALTTLLKVAERGNSRAIAALAALVGDTESDLRKAAGRALLMIAETDDTHAVSGLLAHIELGRPESIDEAVLVLKKIARRGNKPAVVKLLNLARQDDPEIRAVAFRFLGSFAAHADAQVVNVLTDGLRDREVVVATAAAKALPHVAARGDKKVVEGLSKAVGSRARATCVAAAWALPAVSEANDSRRTRSSNPAAQKWANDRALVIRLRGRPLGSRTPRAVSCT